MLNAHKTVSVYMAGAYRQIRIIPLLLLVLLSSVSPVSAETIYTDLPDLGSQADLDLSPSMERRIRKALLRRLGSVAETDPQINYFLKDGGRQLLEASGENPEEFTLVVINNKNINAFAAPGGLIGINTGVFLHAKNQSEVMAVLAHEIAHVTQKHIARAQSKRKPLQLAALASIISGILLSAHNPELGRAAVSLGTAGVIQAQIDFTRENEKEADRIGMQILSRSGYDPHGMPRFFGRLLQASRYTQSIIPEFLRTHPLTKSRIAEAEERAASLATPEVIANELDFALIKAELKIRSTPSALKSAAYFEKILHQKDALDSIGLQAAHYGLALSLIQSRRYAEAKKEVEWLLKQDGHRMQYLATAGILAINQSETETGLRFLHEAQQRHPDRFYPVLLEVESHMALGNAQEARQVLRDYGRFRRENDLGIVYYGALARAEEKAGLSAEAAISYSQVKYLQGRTKSALKLVKAAMNTPGASHYQKQRLQARAQELQAEIALEKKAKVEEKDEDSISGDSLTHVE